MRYSRSLPLRARAACKAARHRAADVPLRSAVRLSIVEVAPYGHASPGRVRKIAAVKTEAASGAALGDDIDMDLDPLTELDFGIVSDEEIDVKVDSGLKPLAQQQSRPQAQLKTQQHPQPQGHQHPPPRKGPGRPAKLSMLSPEDRRQVRKAPTRRAQPRTVAPRFERLSGVTVAWQRRLASNRLAAKRAYYRRIDKMAALQRENDDLQACLKRKEMQIVALQALVKSLDSRPLPSTSAHV